jgi:transposase InsO family protein
LTFLIERGLSQRAACRFLKLNRSTFQYQARPDKNAKVRERLHEFAQSKRRRGYRKAWNKLRRDGLAVGKNRVHRLWKQECLQVKRRSGKKRRRSEKQDTVPLVAQHPDHVWSVDFIFDSTMGGTRLKILTVGDDFTRECLAIAVGTSLPSTKVIGILARLVQDRTTPRVLRMDKGPEFFAHALRAWLAAQQSRTFYIDPGSPWQNGFRESFHGRFRDEFLFGTLFASVAEARVLCEGFRREYNEERPHQSLGYLTPCEFKQQWQQSQSNDCGA